MQTTKKIIAVLLFSGQFLINTSVGATNAGYELSFWPTPSSTKDKRFVSESEHPCGTVVTARVKAMPRYSKLEPFQPERVFEIDRVGNVLRMWRIPVDATPIGIAGGMLRFSYYNSIYVVSLTGRLSKPNGSIKGAVASQADCGSFSEFGDSAYGSCWQFTDDSSKQSRVLAFEGACS
jgi:hypothetical protein